MVAQAACLGSKESGAALRAVAVACSVNALGDLLLVPGLGMGIRGAALATSLSQVTSNFTKGAQGIAEKLDRRS